MLRVFLDSDFNDAEPLLEVLQHLHAHQRTQPQKRQKP